MTAAAHFSVSDTGVLVYVTGGDLASRTLVWVDRNGKEEAIPVEPRAYTMPIMSPDGTRLALTMSDQDQDIRLWDFGRETLTRLTFSPGREYNVAWTPDGTRVAFAASRDGFVNLYWKAALRGAGFKCHPPCPVSTRRSWNGWLPSASSSSAGLQECLHDLEWGVAVDDVYPFQLDLVTTSDAHQVVDVGAAIGLLLTEL